MNFAILFILYVQAIEGLNTKHINVRESLFIVYALGGSCFGHAQKGFTHFWFAGFTLDKLAALREHGVRVFAANLWSEPFVLAMSTGTTTHHTVHGHLNLNHYSPPLSLSCRLKQLIATLPDGFDLAFILIYGVYLVLRVYGLRRGEAWARDSSLEILAMGAVGMFPRLAFVTFSNNIMILSLRVMISQFFSKCLTIRAFQIQPANHPAFDRINVHCGALLPRIQLRSVDSGRRQVCMDTSGMVFTRGM